MPKRDATGERKGRRRRAKGLTSSFLNLSRRTVWRKIAAASLWTQTSSPTTWNARPHIRFSTICQYDLSVKTVIFCYLCILVFPWFQLIPDFNSKAPFPPALKIMFFFLYYWHHHNHNQQHHLLLFLLCLHQLLIILSLLIIIKMHFLFYTFNSSSVMLTTTSLIIIIIIISTIISLSYSSSSSPWSSSYHSQSSSAHVFNFALSLQCSPTSSWASSSSSSSSSCSIFSTLPQKPPLFQFSNITIVVVTVPSSSRSACIHWRVSFSPSPFWVFVDPCSHPEGIAGTACTVYGDKHQTGAQKMSLQTTRTAFLRTAWVAGALCFSPGEIDAAAVWASAATCRIFYFHPMGSSTAL